MDISSYAEEYKEFLTHQMVVNKDAMIKIVAHAAQETMSLDDITKKIRKREYVLARGMAYKYLYDKTTITLIDIGKYFGGKDHATVIHGRNTMNDLLSYHKGAMESWLAFLDKLGVERYDDLSFERAPLNKYRRSVDEKSLRQIKI